MSEHILLLDADGVVIDEQGGLWFSHRFAADFTIDHDRELLPFFQWPFQSCLVWDRDLLEELTLWKERWGWKGTVKELFAYRVEPMRLDIQMLEYIQDLRAAWRRVIVWTNNEIYRWAVIREMLDPYVDAVYCSWSLWYKKPDGMFFTEICAHENVWGDSLVFWDDDEKNVAWAKEIGVESYLYVDYASFVDTITANEK